MEKLTKEQISALPEWLPIEGFPKYEANCRAGLVRNSRTLKVLKPSLDKYGYPHAGMRKDGKTYPKKVHRIVAEVAFGYYGVPTVGLDVCHLDEERNDTRISNLALGSHQENMNFEKAKQRLSDAMKGKRHSKESRKKMSESHKGEKHHLFGKHRSEEVRKRISEAKKGKPNHWFGKHHSVESRMKISEAKKGKPNIKVSKRVGAYKNGELIMVFQSAAEAGRNGFTPSHISSCCTGRRRVHKGYVWKCI